MAAQAPEMTVRSGPATATATGPSDPIRARTSSTDALTAAIRPGSVARIAEARSYTTAAASDGVHSPARVAAVYSPMLLPSSSAGLTPQSRSRRPRA